MKYKLTIGISLLLILLYSGCDPDLFKTEDEIEPPSVSDIYSDHPSFQVYVGDTAYFWVVASDPGGEALSYNWNKSAGNFLTPPDADSVLWRAPVQGGTATIQVNVSNSEKTSDRSKDVNVLSLEKPSVNIIIPAVQSYLVQYEQVEIKAEAFHDNGISYAAFFVNDSLLGLVDGNQSNQYEFIWERADPAGVTEIKVAAYANITGAIGADSITVQIEGVVLGKMR